MKKRVISGVIIAIITVPLCLIGGLPFKIFCFLLGSLCLKEILLLKEHHQKIPLVMEFVCLLDFFLILFLDEVTVLENSKAFVFLVFSLFLPSLFYKEHYNVQDAIYLSTMVLFLGVIFRTLQLIRMRGGWYLIYIGSIPIFTDIFAMLFGNFMGRHKLIPKISPGKTVEGSIGGSVLATVLATLIYFYFIHQAPLWTVLGVTLLLSVVSQFSDLMFSKIKRENGIKDFSNFIPGHGGVLDRMDSLMLVTLSYLWILEFI